MEYQKLKFTGYHALQMESQQSLSLALFRQEEIRPYQNPAETVQSYLM